MTDLLPLLRDFYREKLDMLLRHQAGARLVGQYDANNTYQYIVNRDEVQLSWIAKAIEELGGTLVDQTEPSRAGASRKSGSDAHRIIEEDARDSQTFVERWRPRVDSMTNARHRGMLRIILGETLEQQRFFDQALAGRLDLLGRRGASAGAAKGDVLSSRWIE